MPIYLLATFLNLIIMFNVILSLNFNAYKDIYINELNHIKKDHFFRCAIQKLKNFQIEDIHGVLDEYAKLETHGKLTGEKPDIIISHKLTSEGTEFTLSENSQKKDNRNSINNLDLQLSEISNSSISSKNGLSHKTFETSENISPFKYRTKISSYSIIKDTLNSDTLQESENSDFASSKKNLSDIGDKKLSIVSHLSDVRSDLEVPTSVEKKVSMEKFTLEESSKDNSKMDESEKSDVQKKQIKKTKRHETFYDIKHPIFYFLKYTLIILRGYIVITPLLLTLETHMSAVLNFMYAFNIILLVKIIALININKKIWNRFFKIFITFYIISKKISPNILLKFI